MTASTNPSSPANPSIQPTYDVTRSYDENYDDGPFWSGAFPQPPAGKPQYRFLDFPVYSPVGVPAGPLLNARWIETYARLGFDLPVYKTVRSLERACHPTPNCLFLKDVGTLTPERLHERLVATPESPAAVADISITNSFGMPSKQPETWQADMERARAAMGPGQVFIASCVGTPGTGTGIAGLADDFARTATMAKEAGAQVVEINLSCPNVTSGEGSIYTDPEASARIVRETARALGDTPLMVKVGFYGRPEKLAGVVRAVAPHVRGVAGINTLSFEVVDERGQQALPGEGRLRSGVCGAAIRECGLSQARDLVALKRREKYDFATVGVGGIMTPADIDAYLATGVDAVMSATGAMWDPSLAHAWRTLHNIN
ncbi:MAG: dihydroorotate dehydrogenase [Nitrospirota bacterium]|nr:dihydroorotate dehydrogenase [Nitrospirota bacterium]